MTDKEKQDALAIQAHDRGMINATLRDQILAIRASLDMIESLFDLITWRNLDTTLIERMVQFYRAD